MVVTHPDTNVYNCSLTSSSDHTTIYHAIGYGYINYFSFLCFYKFSFIICVRINWDKWFRHFVSWDCNQKCNNSIKLCMWGKPDRGNASSSKITNIGVQQYILWTIFYHVGYHMSVRMCLLAILSCIIKDVAVVAKIVGSDASTNMGGKMLNIKLKPFREAPDKKLGVENDRLGRKISFTQPTKWKLFLKVMDFCKTFW